MITRVQSEPDVTWFPWALFLVLLHSWLAGNISGWWCWLPLGMVVTVRVVVAFVRGYKQGKALRKAAAQSGSVGAR